jgi:hypothetical protein
MLEIRLWQERTHSWFGWEEKRKVENDLKKTCWEGRDVEPRL